ncbi:MAG: NAD(P)H-dependent oxidoreductase [Candidatus Sericytochromatia bacterium]|nr:NAD(P)H-dependent oxidoreductase [Candidatus Sericytochromatia bacterium]
MKILAVYGATQQDSRSRLTVNVIAEAARAAGAEVQALDVLAAAIPIMRVDQDFAADVAVQQMKQLTRDADGFIVVSPEYHGCMSNWIKNFFDFHYHEFAGKLFALAATTGGSMGVSCNTQMRVAVQHCHGWALPYQTAVREADFAPDGSLQEQRALDRLQRMGRDLVIYGRLLRAQFEQDLAAVKTGDTVSESIGFAGWYA